MTDVLFIVDWQGSFFTFNHNQTPQKGHFLKTTKLITVYGFLFAAGFIVFAVLLLDAWSRKQEHIQQEALGLYRAPAEIARRHVEISMAAKPAKSGEDVPVHIMNRKTASDPWRLCGTGTQLASNPRAVLTAYHVFEERARQYGVRVISPKEFSGTEPVVPIVNVDAAGSTDDAVICSINPEGAIYPVINVPRSDMMLRGYDPQKKYVMRTYFTNVRLLTEPDKLTRTVFHIEMRPGLFHVVVDRETLPGESGTGAVIKGDGPGRYLVLIKQFEMPTGTVEQLTPENRKLLNWHPGKQYTLANMIGVDPTGGKENKK